MKEAKLSILGLTAAGLLLGACAKNKTEDLLINISGLEDLGSAYVYEGWLIVDDAPVSTGTFTVDANGAMSTNMFSVNKKDKQDATTFVLSIEPANDTDPAPSAVKILAGDFNDDESSLSISHSAAIGTDFTAATGKYILATPTDGNNMDENSGVWFLDNSSGSAMAGLSLPTLPEGWKYEGWAVVNGTPLSTGTFTSVTGADESAPYSGTTAGPDFPGEDLLLNAPSGVTFPTDLAGQTIVVSVEPFPDNSTNPFLLKPLVHSVSTTAVDHVAYSMDNNATATNPTGTVSR